MDENQSPKNTRSTETDCIGTSQEKLEIDIKSSNVLATTANLNTTNDPSQISTSANLNTNSDTNLTSNSESINKNNDNNENSNAIYFVDTSNDDDTSGNLANNTSKDNLDGSISLVGSIGLDGSDNLDAVAGTDTKISAKENRDVVEEILQKTRSTEKKWPVMSTICAYTLFIIFALGSWIDLNAIYSQLAILMSILPERYELPSYIAITVQCANVFPILFTLGTLWKPKIFHERPTIYFIIGWGCIGLVLMAFFYDHIVVTSVDANRAISVPLILITFSLALVDTLSTVTFLPYMSLFDPKFLSPFFIGQSLSGFIPSILTLLQGIKVVNADCSQYRYFNSLRCFDQITIDCSLPVDNTPSTNDFNANLANMDSGSSSVQINSGLHFTTRTYFLIIAAVMLLSMISFILINRLQFMKKYFLKSYPTYYREKIQTGKSRPSGLTTTDNSNDHQLEPFKVNRFQAFFKSFIVTPNRVKFDVNTTALLVCLTLVSFMANGITVQVMSFATLFYGSDTFNYSNNLYLASGAVTSALLIWIKPPKPVLICIIYTCLFLVICIYTIAVALLGKNGILLPLDAANATLIISYIISGHVYNAVRQMALEYCSRLGTNYVVLCSILIQIGSFFGTFVMFFPISIGCIFY